jgi:hypothetical protein
MDRMLSARGTSIVTPFLERFAASPRTARHRASRLLVGFHRISSSFRRITAFLSAENRQLLKFGVARE